MLRNKSIIDWHSHILPGLDDGSPDIDHSLVMARLLAAHGFTTVYCTPHMIRGHFEAGNDQVLQAVSELQGLVTANGIPLTLLPGREYYLDEYLLHHLEDPLPLGDSKLILVEIPATTAPDTVQQLFYAIVRAGFAPVVAHPERCPLLTPGRRQAEKGGLWGRVGRFLPGGGRQETLPRAGGGSGNQLLDYLRDLGCSFQGNLGSFNGFYGDRAKSSAEAFRSLGIYDRYGSDLHATEHAQRILGQPQH